MTTTTEFQLVDINKLVPYANNARTHNKEQILKLRSSLREFGFVNPVTMCWLDMDALWRQRKKALQKCHVCMPTI